MTISPSFLRVLLTTPPRRCRLMGTACLWPLLRDGWKMLLGLRHVNTAPPGLAAIRMKLGCVRCPIYDPERRACGTTRVKCMVPHGEHEHDFGYIEVPLGCGCHMPTKVTMLDEECWLDKLAPYKPVIITPGCDELQAAIDALPPGPRWSNPLPFTTPQA